MIQKKCTSEPFEFLLPRKVTTKFITAVFIESEDYIEDGDADDPRYCNVEV